ncbi:MAG: DUF4209 domain-containing protein [Chitinophagales bacterium]
MRIKDIDIQQFKTIEEIYPFLNANASQLERYWDIVNLFVKYRNFASTDEEKQKAQWEIEAFMFHFKRASLFSFSYSTGKNIGQVKQFPQLDEFQKEAFEYLQNRAETSLNHYLLAKYNHLLWKAPKGIKNRKYALIAINAYVNLIKEIYHLYQSHKTKHIPGQIGQLYETLAGLCNEVKGGILELKNLTRFLLFETKDFEFYVLHGIIDDMIMYPKIFKPEDFENTLSIFEADLKKEKEKPDDFLKVNYHLPSAIKVANQIKADVKFWHNEVALAYLRMAERETKPDRNWIKADYYFQAIISFTRSGNAKQKRETEKLNADLKPYVVLNNVEIKFDEATQRILKLYDDWIKFNSIEILKKTPETVYSAIANAFMFPKYDHILKATQGQKNSLKEMFKVIQFDKNKNIIKRAKNDIYNEDIYRLYGFQINNGAIAFLHYVLIEGIKSGHLTFENLLLFLVEKTWIGKPHSKIDLGNEEKEQNWIAQLTPAIVEFFIQVQSWVISKYYKPSFVLCTDSLALKIEGVLRDFCERINIPVSVGKSKGMKEIFLSDLLAKDQLKDFFNQDDMLFFNYLFSDNCGPNIRNNVAHCFYHFEDYHPDKMLLLIAALLRIGKYDYTET